MWLVRYFDVKKAITVSGINGLVLTKLDVLDSFKDIKYVQVIKLIIK